MATKVSMVQLEAIVTRRIRSGITGMAQLGAKEFRREVTRVTEKGFPVGPFEGPHSTVGEYPHRETGQGADNAAWELSKTSIAAGFGVRGEDRGIGPYRRGAKPGGMHLFFLEAKGRKFADDVLLENAYRFRTEFRKRARR